MRVSRLFAIAASLVVVTLVFHRVAMTDLGVPVHMPAGMRFTTTCVNAASTLTQSFRIAGEAITGVTVIPSLTPPADGEMRFELRTGKEPSVGVTYESTLPLREVASGVPLTLRWPRIARTGGGDFTLSISRTEGGGCLAFLASAVHAPDARLQIGGRDVYGDLLFHVHAYRGTILHRVQDWLVQRAGVMVPFPLLIAVACGYGLAIVVFAQWLVAVGASRSVTSVSGRPSAFS